MNLILSEKPTTGRTVQIGTCQHYSASHSNTANIFENKPDGFEWNKGSLDERDKQIADNLINSGAFDKQHSVWT